MADQVTKYTQYYCRVKTGGASGYTCSLMKRNI